MTNKQLKQYLDDHRKIRIATGAVVVPAVFLWAAVRILIVNARDAFSAIAYDLGDLGADFVQAIRDMCSE